MFAMLGCILQTFSGTSTITYGYLQLSYLEKVLISFAAQFSFILLPGI